jgi:radical SAM superfamily enzyme YgiQ (UPF0313 family)
MLEYEGSIWRPPSEARSLILQATVGCSHNACIFCVSYKKKKYRVRGRTGLAMDLDRLPDDLKRRTRRVFLADGNALAMPYEDWTESLQLIYQELPNLERVSVYGYARDVDDKTIEDLRDLKESGLNLVYLGLETGHDELLKWSRKGVTSREIVDACKKIKAANIPLSLTIILGLGGSEKSKEHAIATASVLNEIDPEYVGALTLMIPKDTPLFKLTQRDEFSPMNPIEILNELYILIENLELTSCIFRTNHASNYLAVGGTLNQDKEKILSSLRTVLETKNENILRPSYLRGL